MNTLSFKKSEDFIAEASSYLAGGVSSNFRLGMLPGPLAFTKAEGAILNDVDGNRLIDYYGAMGPMILGHNPAAVREKVATSMNDAILVGGQSQLEVDAAKLLCQIVPVAERVRFSGSGSEAVQGVLRLVRAATGRTKVIKFEGHEQGWVDEIISDLDELCNRVKAAKKNKEVVSIAYDGNIIDVWEKFHSEDIFIDLGSDQTSLHNPWAGGYYPTEISFDQANDMMRKNPEKFKEKVKDALSKHAGFIKKHTDKGTYFFDYGNAFLLEASRAGADVMSNDGINFKYPS